VDEETFKEIYAQFFPQGGRKIIVSIMGWLSFRSYITELVNDIQKVHAPSKTYSLNVTVTVNLKFAVSLEKIDHDMYSSCIVVLLITDISGPLILVLPPLVVPRPICEKSGLGPWTVYMPAKINTYDAHCKVTWLSGCRVQTGI